MAMRTEMNFGEGITLVFDRTGAKEILREMMLEIAAKQEKALKEQEQRLAKAYQELAKSEQELAKAQQDLAKSEGRLLKAEKELEKEQNELNEIRENTEALKKQHLELEKEKKLMKSFSNKQDKFSVYIQQINELAEQFTVQVLKRGELTSTLVNKIKAYNEEAELTEEKLIHHLEVIQASFDDVTNEVEVEDAILDQIPEAFQAYEVVLNEMKVELDELALTSKALYDKHILSYERALCWVGDLKSKFDKSLAYKFTNDETGKNCAKILDDLEDRLEQEKLAAEEKNSPSTSENHALRSNSEILVSNSDENASHISDVSNISLFLARKRSPSSEEEKSETVSLKSSKSTVSSSAVVSALLPPSPVIPSCPLLKSDFEIDHKPSAESESQLLSNNKLEPQTPTFNSKAPTASLPFPKQEISLLAKLGFKKNKSLPPSQIPVAENSVKVTPIVKQ